MSNLFGTQKLEFGPTLSSGLAPWQHELKLKSGENVKFVPLHPLEESFALWVHRKQFRYGDNGYKFIPSGKKMNPPVQSPFDSSPDPEVNGIKPLRYMLVLVISGKEDLNGHVAYLELRNNQKKRDGTYDRMAKYEADSDSHSVQNMKCSLSRKGTGLTDTVYESSITDEYKIKKAEQEVIDVEVPELVDYLKTTYLKEWTPEDFAKVYHEAVASQLTGGNVAVTSTHPVADDSEIPF